MYKSALHMLTDGYATIAQMPISLAQKLGYIDEPQFMVVTPGDDTSAGLPYAIDAYQIHEDAFGFLSFNEYTHMQVPANHQVLVYEYIAPPSDMSPEGQINLLSAFAHQFDKTSLIGQLITPDLIAWLRSNTEFPDIYYEYNRMKRAANHLEDELGEYQDLYDADLWY
ncbi:MAG: hypothetical protein AAFQ07_16475 [Chloroflexota bacterium]